MCSIAKAKLKTMISVKSKELIAKDKNSRIFGQTLSKDRADRMATDHYSEYNEVVNDLIILTKENGDVILSAREYKILKELTDG